MTPYREYVCDVSHRDEERTVETFCLRGSLCLRKLGSGGGSRLLSLAPPSAELGAGACTRAPGALLEVPGTGAGDDSPSVCAAGDAADEVPDAGACEEEEEGGEAEADTWPQSSKKPSPESLSPRAAALDAASAACTAAAERPRA